MLMKDVFLTKALEVQIFRKCTFQVVSNACDELDIVGWFYVHMQEILHVIFNQR